MRIVNSDELGDAITGTKDKRNSCKKFNKKREMTKLSRFHSIKEKRCLLKFQLQYQL